MSFVASSFYQSATKKILHDYDAPIDIPSLKSAYKGKICNCLEKCKTLVAYSLEDPEHIYGYLIYEPGIIHFAYVRFAVRMSGILRQMIKHSDIDASMPFVISHIPYFDFHKHKITFNPFIFWGKF